MGVKYPNVTVALSEMDGNAFSIIGATRKALRRAGVSEDEIQQFSDEAKNGDYLHLIETVMEWVEAE